MALESPGAAPRRPKRGLLSRSAEFERVYRQGRSRANRFLVLYSFPRGGGDGPRLGVSVSRKVGGAVDRNRVKRVLREAFHACEDGLPPENDYVLVARPPARELAEREGLDGVSQALAELLTGGSDSAAGEDSQLTMGEAAP